MVIMCEAITAQAIRRTAQIETSKKGVDTGAVGAQKL